MQWKHLKLKVCWSVVSLAGGRWRPRARGRRRCSVSSVEIKGHVKKECPVKKEASASVAASVGDLDNDSNIL